MTKSKLLPLFTIVFVLGAMAGVFITRSTIDANAIKLTDTAKLITERYVDSTDYNRLIENAFNGMFSHLDSYSIYLPREAFKEFQEDMEGKFGGLGIIVEFDEKDKFVKIIMPLEDSPALKAGLLSGDKIIAVNGKSTKDVKLENVVKIMKGAPGTRVTIRILRNGKEPFDVTIVRAVISIKSVKYKMLDSENKIAYIRINSFNKDTVSEFSDAILKLQQDGLKSLVLDLRFNHGGLLDKAIELADKFIESGVLVSTKGRTSDDNKTYNANKEGTLSNFPLILLVNEESASASEIFSGAIKDHKRGVLVGTRTYGKGCVQTVFDFHDGTAIKLTTARYFTPSGINIDKGAGNKEYGIEPNYLIELTPDEKSQLLKNWNKPSDSFVDKQIEKALEILKEQMKNEKH